MKFHWGTGITIFLILFLAACAVFIVFAMRQEVSLVHEDYYERGVDHTGQMEKEVRSEPYRNSIFTRSEPENLVIYVDSALASAMDSASVLLFRPSNPSLDLQFSFNPSANALQVPRKRLEMGRYILEMGWSSEGLDYEVEIPVFVE